MDTRVQKWGESLVLRIPDSLANQLGLEPDAPVALSRRGTELILTPLNQERLTLDDLLAQVTPDNLHGEVDTGPAVGREVGGTSGPDTA